MGMGAFHSRLPTRRTAARRGLMFQAIVKDPDGNAIILHKLKSAEERGG
jgi:hypothetical protein